MLWGIFLTPVIMRLLRSLLMSLDNMATSTCIVLDQKLKCGKFTTVCHYFGCYLVFLLCQSTQWPPPTLTEHFMSFHENWLQICTRSPYGLNNLAQGSNSCAANILQQKKYYAFSYVDTVCGLKVCTDKDYFQCICFVWHNEAQLVIVMCRGDRRFNFYQEEMY